MYRLSVNSKHYLPSRATRGHARHLTKVFARGGGGGRDLTMTGHLAQRSTDRGANAIKVSDLRFYGHSDNSEFSETVLR